MWSNLLDQLNLPSPIEKIELDLFTEKDVELYIKRDDLIHPQISGNKWRKLKYNLKYSIENNISTVITFGGAFSNHLYAVAAACKEINIHSVGIIRGEIDINNPTIRFCMEKGMQLIPVSRSAYREKEDSSEIKSILNHFDNYFLIPEGGSNDIALVGVSEIWGEINARYNMDHFDCIALPVGTGTTIAGILKDNLSSIPILGFSVLKTSHLEAEINKILCQTHLDNFKIINSYHFGGYGKYNAQLDSFITDFESLTNIPLDHVYNAKALFGLFDMIDKNYFKSGTKILYIHTGGLQGKDGKLYIETKKNKV